MKINLYLFGGRGASSSLKKTITSSNIIFPEGVNQKQQSAIKSIAEQIPRFDFYNDKDYEIKRFDVTALKNYNDIYSVSVVVETGRKNDEGTYGALINRKRRMFWVGKNGGIKVMTKGNKLKKVSQFELLNKYYER